MEHSSTTYMFIFLSIIKAQNCLDISLLVVFLSLSDSSRQDYFMLGLKVKFVSNIMFNSRISVLTFSFILTAENIKHRYNLQKLIEINFGSNARRSFSKYLHQTPDNHIQASWSLTLQQIISQLGSQIWRQQMEKIEINLYYFLHFQNLNNLHLDVTSSNTAARGAKNVP